MLLLIKNFSLKKLVPKKQNKKSSEFPYQNLQMTDILHLRKVNG